MQANSEANDVPVRATPNRRLCRCGGVAGAADAVADAVVDVSVDVDGEGDDDGRRLTLRLRRRG